MKPLIKKGLGVIVLIAIVLFFQLQPSLTASVDHKADLVMFSFDRPLQLYALLESVEKYLKGVSEKHVIYRSSNDQFEQGYGSVKEQFTDVIFHKQGDNPSTDFKPLTLKATFESPAAYVLFAVDDIVMKDNVNLADCIAVLENHNVHGFYLRLGKQLTTCYSLRREQPVPSMQERDGFCIWYFNQGMGDWCYPHTVDMTLYRKKDIHHDFSTLDYYAPNRLEDLWDRAARTKGIYQKQGACFVQSKIVNLPLNRVQNDYKNRVMSEYNPADLLQIFMQGKKMDIAPLNCMNNTAAHMEYSPTFINR